jgi:hypothetical protein
MRQWFCDATCFLGALLPEAIALNRLLCHFDPRDPANGPATKPSARHSVPSVSRMLPAGASCYMRAAKCVVCPTAVWSMRRSLPIERTTTSPELTPMRICTSAPCARRLRGKAGQDRSLYGGVRRNECRIGSRSWHAVGQYLLHEERRTGCSPQPRSDRWVTPHGFEC